MKLHPQALVDPGAIVGAHTRVWAFAMSATARSSGGIATSATTHFLKRDVRVGNRVNMKQYGFKG